MNNLMICYQVTARAIHALNRNSRLYQAMVPTIPIFIKVDLLINTLFYVHIINDLYTRDLNRDFCHTCNTPVLLPAQAL